MKERSVGRHIEEDMKKTIGTSVAIVGIFGKEIYKASEDRVEYLKGRARRAARREIESILGKLAEIKK